KQLAPRNRVVWGVLAVPQANHVTQRGQPRADLAHLYTAVDPAVAEAVAADGEQHRRLELGEPIHDAARPELGCAAGPDRTEARGGGKRHERLGDVRHVGDDAVARADAE